MKTKSVYFSLLLLNEPQKSFNILSTFMFRDHLHRLSVFNWRPFLFVDKWVTLNLHQNFRVLMILKKIAFGNIVAKWENACDYIF